MQTTKPLKERVPKQTLILNDGPVEKSLGNNSFKKTNCVTGRGRLWVKCFFRTKVGNENKQNFYFLIYPYADRIMSSGRTIEFVRSLKLVIDKKIILKKTTPANDYCRTSVVRAGPDEFQSAFVYV